MIAAAAEPLWHEAVNAALLVGGLFGLLLAVHFSAARRWWKSFGRALEDISGREQMP